MLLLGWETCDVLNRPNKSKMEVNVLASEEGSENLSNIGSHSAVE